jgi:lysine-N-methylase
MKLTVLQNENFTCQSCTLCCRSWYVELIAGEEERTRDLRWPAGDPLIGKDPIFKHGGKTYLARRADGACLFLNDANGLCRIHEQFGAANKPLGCRVFPFQISPTFKGEASVLGRMDCPTIRKNVGAPYTEEVSNLRRYASQINLSNIFDEQLTCGLSREQIEAVCEFILTLMNGFARDDQRALFIIYFCHWLGQQDIAHLDRASLAQIFPQLKQLVETATSAPVKRPNAFQRFAFRTLLGLYLRRDEDVLNGRASRIGRMLALTNIIFGGGSFHSLGVAHRAGKLRRARLFKQPLEPRDTTTFALFWRMIRNRLESFQFMGERNSHRNFLRRR